MNFWIIIYFLFILFLFYRYRKEHTIRRWILFLYLFSASFSVLKLFVEPLHYSIDGRAILYYLMTLFIVLFPIIRNGYIDNKYYSFNKNFLDKLSVFLIIFGIISLSYYLPKVFSLRTMLNNMSEVRLAYYNGEVDYVPSSILEILCNWVSYIQFISPFLCFYYLLQNEKKRALLLFVVSLLPAVENLIIGEREACVIVLGNFVFSYIFYKDVIPKSYMEKIRIFGIILVSPFILFIVAMTFARFENTDGGVLSSLIVYIGDQPYNYSYQFSSINIADQCLHGKLCFPYFFAQNEQLTGPLNDYINSPMYLNVFAGLPGFFLLDFGYYSIFVLALFSMCFFFLTRYKRKQTQKLGFNHLFIFLIYYQIVFMGLFYFRYSSKYFVIMCLLVALSSKAYQQFSKK